MSAEDNELGAGLMPFGTGPFGLFESGELVEERTQKVASRQIDASGRWVQLEDSLGGFKGMSDTAHRVIMILGRVRLGPFVTPRARAEGEAEIRRLLAPLNVGRQPVMRIERLDIIDSGRAGLGYYLKFKDLTDGRIKVLKAE